MSMRQQVRDVESIAGRIILLRESREWKPVDAYTACGLEKTAWNNYEAGNRPGIDAGAAICDVFGVDLAWLYTGATSGLSQQALSQLYGRQA